MWCIYSLKYYSAIKKKSKVMPFAATCMDLEIVQLSEIKSDTGRHISYSITYTWNLKKGYK